MENSKLHDRFLKQETKSNYKMFLNEAIGKFKMLADITQDPIYRLIQEQLVDIGENVVNLQIYNEWDEINERYSLGGIAIKNFGESEYIYRYLLDLFNGAIKYSDLP